MVKTKPEPVQIVEKKVPGEKIVYVLRCLWVALEDEKAQPYIRWHPDRNDAFIIPDERALDDFFRTYDFFQTNFGTFRRSLYFYGFSKRKNVWSHPNLNKTSRDSLMNIHRKKKDNKVQKLHNQLRKKYEKLMRETMLNSMPSLNSFTMPPMVGKTPPNHQVTGPAQHQHHALLPAPLSAGFNPMLPPFAFPSPYGLVRSPTFAELPTMYGDVATKPELKEMKTDSKVPTRFVNGRNVATLESPSFNHLPFFSDPVPAGLKTFMRSASTTPKDEIKTEK